MYLGLLDNLNFRPQLISVPDDPVTPFEEPREGLGVQPAEVVRLVVYRLVVRLEEHCKNSNS